MDTQSPRLKRIINVDEVEKVPNKPINRRTLLKVAGISGAGVLATTLVTLGAQAWTPKRVSAANAGIAFPDVQFDIGKFISPVQTIAGIPVQFGPVFTYMSPVVLARTPNKTDQQVLANALNTIEANYAFSPSGIFTIVSYGLPYFNRLPSSLVASHMPRLIFEQDRFVLEEAVPSPTDISPLNPTIKKKTFNVPVQIETNDLLFTFRSDQLSNILDTVAWLGGSNSLNGKTIASPEFNGLLQFQTPRVNFIQQGLPRKLANKHQFSFANEVNPASTMWMGFIDQQVDSSAANGKIVTFVGSDKAHLTTAKPGDYFDHGAIQHLSHVIDDLPQFYSKDPADPEPFSERVQYMFRSKKADRTPGLPFPVDPNDGFTNGGGLGAPAGNLATQQQSAFLENFFFGPEDIATNFDPEVTDHPKYRVGHEQALQRSSRAPDGTPLHIRIDGPGLSSLDVPDGSTQPTLEFSIFVPTAEFFRVMRINAASLDYVKNGQQGGTASSVGPGEEACDPDDNGLERFITTTRRQNFLVTPRRNRAFPLVELV